MKYKPCPHCRASNQEHVANCFSCGKSMDEPRLDSASEPAVARRHLPLRSFLLLLLLGLAGFGGWWYGRDDTTLRVEVTRLTNRGEGLILPSQSVSPGETLFFDLALRGWTPDAQKNCKGVLSMSVSGPFPLYFESPYETFEFPKRSRITHIPIATTLRIPKYMEPGDYTVQVMVRDEVAKKDAEFRHTFRIDGPATDRDRRAHSACAENVDAISRACLRFMNAQKELPKSLRDLSPTYFPEPPVCPAAGRSTYRLLGDSHERTAIFCAGSWHSSVGAREDHPSFRGRFQSDRAGGYYSGDRDHF